MSIGRRSGVLLHVTSLPGPYGAGDFGTGARRFAEFLKEAGFSLWQLLPLTPVLPVFGHSPYSSPSAFAGNPSLVSPELLFEDGLATKAELDGCAVPSGRAADFAAASEIRARLCALAFARFKSGWYRQMTDEFEKFTRSTPVIANVRPSGIYAVDDLHFAGGVPQIFKQLESLINKDCLNVNGQTLGEILSHVKDQPGDVIRSVDNPICAYGGLAILKGNLAPNGSVVRSSTVKDSMQHFRGTAKVYQSDSEAHQAIISEEVKPGDVVVVRYVGPVGAPGMVEIMEATEAIVNLGLDESVALITDGRFSGFCHGPIIGHVSPEAAIGGPIALVEDGDIIEIDIENRSLKLDVPEEELEKRRQALVLPEPRVKKGFMRTYAKNCLPPERGAAMQSWD